MNRAGDPSPQVRVAVAEAIGRINDPSKSSVLLPMLADVDPEVRRSAATALGMLRAEFAQGALRDALIVPGQPMLVRRAVAAAIAAAPASDQQVQLIAALRDTDEQVRAYAADALGQVGDSEALQALEALSADETVILGGTVATRARAAMKSIERRGRKATSAAPAGIETK